MSAPTRVVVADANILINLCHAGQLPAREAGRLRVRRQRRGRRRDHQPASATSAPGDVRSWRHKREELASVTELALYADLRAVMGSGEASCLALAQSRRLYVASDERGVFLRGATARLGENKGLTTPGLFVLAIRMGLLTIAMADAAKLVLERHRFKMRFASFADVLVKRGNE